MPTELEPPTPTTVPDLESGSPASLAAKPTNSIHPLVRRWSVVCSRLHVPAEALAIVTLLIVGILLTLLELYSRVTSISEHMVQAGALGGEGTAAMLLLGYDADQA